MNKHKSAGLAAKSAAMDSDGVRVDAQDRFCDSHCTWRDHHPDCPRADGVLGTPAPDLRSAAQAVLDRWNSPKWEWHKQGPTADLMADLRRALDGADQHQTVHCRRCETWVTRLCDSPDACSHGVEVDADLDSIALEAAQEIALMWGRDRTQFIAKIQVAVRVAMQRAAGVETACRCRSVGECHHPDTCGWPDSDDEGGTCSICGKPTLYGSRHVKCVRDGVKGDSNGL